MVACGTEEVRGVAGAGIIEVGLAGAVELEAGLDSAAVGTATLPAVVWAGAEPAAALAP